MIIIRKEAGKRLLGLEHKSGRQRPIADKDERDPGEAFQCGMQAFEKPEKLDRQPATQPRHLKRGRNTDNRNKPLNAKSKPSRRILMIDKDEEPDKNLSINELYDYLKKHMQRIDESTQSERGDN